MMKQTTYDSNKAADPHATSSVDDCCIIDLPRRLGENGNLTEVENTPACPFEIKRVYYLYDVPADSERGGHSHHQAESLIIALSGSFEVTLDDGARRKRVTLNRPYRALYLRKGIWRTLDNFSAGSVCLCISSEKYDPADYVRSYDEFLRLTAPKRRAALRYPFLSLQVVNEPYMQAAKEAACRVIESGRYIGGPEVEALEADLCHLTGARHAVACSNGLDALRLIFRACIELGRLKEGDEVLVPADTFVATFLAISDCGLTPVPVDADPATFNLTAEAIERAITPRTRAIALVHLYGRVCWSRQIADAAENHGLFVAEDCAQALGAKACCPGLNGSMMAGALGHAAGISFYPTKNVGAMGDAGAVLAADADLAAAVRALGNYGSDRQYHNIYCGFNCRCDPMQAAILRAKLPFLDAENEHRRLLAATYDACISNPAVAKPLFPHEAPLSHVWHQYTVLADDRDAFRAFLLANGVETAVHYPIAPHQQPCYASLPHGPLPAAEHIAAHVVSLPISSGTSAADAEAISEIINGYAK